ncbi:MAG: peptidyl-tRNA hydrolase [Candidatus Aenigmarchaeota archaeon]|nr:peptidyl-tRNA hydrolase [Candidatus Aenigmarchaeota archaeon]
MYKQVIVVRKDLKMGKGKLLAHVLHAAIGSLRLADEEVTEMWENEGAKKVVLKVSDIKEIKEIEEKLKKNKVPHFLVRDAGLTQLKKGTITAVGIGPVEEKKIDKITGKLKLL